MKYLRIIMVYMAASLLAVFVGFDLAFAPTIINLVGKSLTSSKGLHALIA